MDLHRRGALALLALALAAPPLAAAPRYYESDASGMALREILGIRKDDFEHSLSVERSGATEVRILYARGVEQVRWESDYGASGSKTEERRFEGGSLAERNTWNAAGLLLRTERYVRGSLSETTDREYAAGRLKRLVVKDALGALLYTDSFSYSLKGSLREMRRDYASGALVLSTFAGLEGRLSEERLTEGGITTVWKYTPLGFLASEERFRGEAPLSSVRFSYRDPAKDSRPQAIESVDFLTKERSETLFTAAGELEFERSYAGETLVKEVAYGYEGGRLVRRTSVAGALREEWTYAYDAAGTLVEELHSKAGEIFKLTIWKAGGEKVEELYKDGAAFLRVYYQGGAKKREEILSAGEVVRARDFE